MTSIFRYQSGLAQNPGEKVLGHKIAARAGMTLKRFHKEACVMVRDGHISREKTKDGAFRYYVYYLNEEQLQAFRIRVARHEKALSTVKKHEDIQLPADTRDLSGRLGFLRMLKEKTVFGEHAMLGLIINDYERTLKMRQKVEGAE